MKIVMLITLLFMVMSCSKSSIYPVSETKETIIRVIETEIHDTIEIEKECNPENKIIRTIYFSFDSYELSDKSKAILDNVDTSKPLEIKAHTCDIGTELYNRSLRMQRGNEVYNYLFDNEKNNSFINYSEEKCNHGNRKFCRNVEVVAYE